MVSRDERKEIDRDAANPVSHDEEKERGPYSSFSTPTRARSRQGNFGRVRV